MATNGDCEVAIGLHRQAARRKAPEYESAIQLGCGIGWRTELAAAFARRRSDEAREDVIDIEGRTSLHERQIGRPGWALLYGFGAGRSSGKGAWRHTGQFIAIEATLQPAVAWLVEATIGTARDRVECRTSSLWALAVEHVLSKTLELRAEVDGDDHSRPLMGVALHYQIWPDHALVTLSHGVRASAPRERHLGVGISFEF